MKHIILGVAFGLSACGGGGKPAAPPAAEIGAEARQVFETRCVACHGKAGAGDGPAAAAMNPKPRNYKDASWQASVTDEALKKVILEGGAAVGKSPLMPGNPDLQAKTQVVDDLVKIIRSFGGK